MKLHHLSRYKEIWCVLFGHQWNEETWHIEDDLVFEHSLTCDHCGLAVVDKFPTGFKRSLSEPQQPEAKINDQSP